MKILAHLLLWVYYYYLWYKGFRELACIECVLDLKKKGLIQEFWRTSNITINFGP